jgi:hypothetical protein
LVVGTGHGREVVMENLAQNQYFLFAFFAEFLWPSFNGFFPSRKKAQKPQKKKAEAESSRWGEVVAGAALVVVALSGWCVFPEDAGPTGLKILFWLDNLQRCRADGAGVRCHAGWKFGCVL